jgi:hypothetical protein
MITRFLTRLAKMEPRTGGVALAGTGSIIECAISEPRQARHRIRRTLLAHRQRDMATGGRIV